MLQLHGVPLHVRTSPLPCQQSIAGKEEVVCHNYILYRISIVSTIYYIELA